MSAISNFLTFLRSAIYAIDVRDGIADAIEQCYNDVNNPTLKTEALEAALQTKIDEGEMAALTIGDGTITAAKLASGVIDNTLATSGAAADAKKTGDEIAAVKADLGVINFVKDYYIKTSTTPINLTPVYSSAGRMYAVIDCSPGDKFVINAYSDWGDVRAWCFIDNSNNAVSMADANVTVTDLELTAPANAVKLIINDMSGGMSYKVGNNLATKASNGLSDDVKEALLVCFRNIAWSAQDYGDIIKDLEDAFNGNYDGFFNTWEWNLGDNIVKQSAGCDIDANYKLDINYNANRRTLVTTKGRFPLNKHDGTGESIYYPIPVPRNANKAVITWAPSTQYANCTALYYIGDGKYDRVRGSVFAWTTGGRLEVPLYETDCIRVMVINIKYNQAGTSYPTEPAAVNVKFSIEE